MWAEALWQAQRQDAQGYFRGKLGTIDEPTTPFGLADVYGDGSEIEEYSEAVEPSLARRIRRGARRLGVSCATLFHAAWGLVVGSTSAREDVVFGSVLSGRMQGSEGADRVLGMFINTLPMRLQLWVSVGELVQQTQREVVELLRYEQTPLSLAQRCSGLSAGVPLFSAVLNYRHSARQSAAEKRGPAVFGYWAGRSGPTIP